MIEASHLGLSIRRQCELIGLCRASPGVRRGSR